LELSITWEGFTIGMGLSFVLSTIYYLVRNYSRRYAAVLLISGVILYFVGVILVMSEGPNYSANLDFGVAIGMILGLVSGKSCGNYLAAELKSK